MKYMPKQNIIFGGVSLSAYGAYAIYCNTLDTPKRSVDVVNVPGRNGALVFDNGRYDDVTRTYVVVSESYDGIRALLAALSAVTGYARLSDGYEPDMYMMARLTDVTMPVILQDGACRVTLSFVRKPQKYLAIGETLTQYANGAKLANPTTYTALPLVKVTGTGTVTIGSETITISTNATYTFIDCETQNAYKDGTNLNANISLTSGNFFSLAPGTTGVTFANTITEVMIAPRWWTL